MTLEYLKFQNYQPTYQIYKVFYWKKNIQTNEDENFPPLNDNKMNAVRL